MAKLDLTYDLVNYTPASATPVEVNFNRAEQHINQELIERDGSVAMRAQLKLIGDPVAPLDAAPKQYVDAVLPVGIIMMYGGVTPPLGGRWALCNGAEVETVTYPDLYAVLSSRYSPAGTPAGRFNLPNLLDRFPIGAGTTAALGTAGGSKDSVVPTHSHSIDHGHASTTSGNDAPDHVHNGVDHFHGVNINSGTESAHHTHGTGQSGQDFLTIGSGLGGPGTSVNNTNRTTNTGNNNSLHYHNVSGSTGGSDRLLTTGGRSVFHQHPTSTPAMTGTSGTTGVAVTNANLPPYLGVTYIIRVS